MRGCGFLSVIKANCYSLAFECDFPGELNRILLDEIHDPGVFFGRRGEALFPERHVEKEIVDVQRRPRISRTGRDAQQLSAVVILGPTFRCRELPMGYAIVRRFRYHVKMRNVRDAGQGLPSKPKGGYCLKVVVAADFARGVSFAQKRQVIEQNAGSIVMDLYLLQAAL